jgi:hypothetical protein
MIFIDDRTAILSLDELRFLMGTIDIYLAKYMFSTTLISISKLISS